ncbi:hypothetical protein H2201_008644 [Coniosporium apollinis]|uniref:Letm1 RBD domain-containing protein n=1 Tax=Coniosporium apollinis TaxID=61459 RepID=A0ABQ9NIV8_9PEZI|nr:hypothetical protein H2201_008644 [Coniosporium apollinis]
MLARQALGCQPFLRLPPQLRTTLYRRSLRPFYSSPIHQFQYPDLVAYLDLACAVPHATLTTLHATGLPWVVVLPLSAFLIRGLVLVPALSIPSRRAQQRWLNIHPLKSAWTNAIRKLVLMESGEKGPSYVEREVQKKSLAKMSELHRQFRTGWIRRLAPVLVQFPVFLCLAETVRRM